jgi:hypothetical protein
VPGNSAVAKPEFDTNAVLVAELVHMTMLVRS